MRQLRAYVAPRPRPPGVAHAADRKWRTGTWTDVGVKAHAISGQPSATAVRRASTRPRRPKSPRNDHNLRLELRDMVTIGREAFDLHVTVGSRVTFAVEKKTAYIKLDGGEYRLLVLKSERKKERNEDRREAHEEPEAPLMVIQAYKDGLAGLRAANPDVHLRVGRDPSAPDEPVLFVAYPAPTADPAGRDVHCDAENHDWTGGRAISFHVKPAQPMRLSVSFLDRNRVAYTAWTELKGGVWQQVRIPFDEIRPNPYFQRPDAKTGASLDVSAVQHRLRSARSEAGRLIISGLSSQVVAVVP